MCVTSSFILTRLVFHEILNENLHEMFWFAFSVFTCSMKKLKEEMEGVVKELTENNHLLER